MRCRNGRDGVIDWTAIRGNCFGRFLMTSLVDFARAHFDSGQASTWQYSTALGVLGGKFGEFGGTRRECEDFFSKVPVFNYGARDSRSADDDNNMYVIHSDH